MFEKTVDKICEEVSELGDRLGAELNERGTIPEENTVVTNVLREMEERQGKKCSLIIHGVPKTLNVDKKSLLAMDKSKLDEIINTINLHNVNITGNADRGDGISNRTSPVTVSSNSIQPPGMSKNVKLIDPKSVLFVNRIDLTDKSGSGDDKSFIKIKMSDQHSANTLLQNFIMAKKYQQNHAILKGVKIVKDSTLSQRRQKKKSWEDMQLKLKSGEKDLVLRMVNGDFKAVKKKESRWPRGPRVRTPPRE